MKKIVMLMILCIPIVAYTQETMFVAAKSGLSLRATKSISGNNITSIPYGEKVSIDSITEQITIDGFNSSWAAITYKEHHGYVVNAYLLPIAPPSISISELENYAEQLSTKACQPIVNIDGDTATGFVVTDKKTLYKNGFIYTVHNNYEYISESLVIPGISIQQAYIIVQNIPYLKNFLPIDGKFPEKSDSRKSSTGDYRQTILQYYEHIDGNYKKLQKLQFIVDETNIDGVLSIMELNQQVVIIIENGS